MTKKFFLETWCERGACAAPENKDVVNSFYATTPRERDTARNLCVSQCPVRAECLRWALEHSEIWGVWGGCDESELRRALSLNAVKQSVDRSRHPHCPYCSARPSKLKIVKVHRPNSHRIDEHIECVECGFYWRARTSIAAIRAYWRERRILQVEQGHHRQQPHHGHQQY